MEDLKKNKQTQNVISNLKHGKPMAQNLVGLFSIKRNHLEF